MLARFLIEEFERVTNALSIIQTSEVAPIQHAHSTVSFPDLETRLWIAGASWILLGGLAFLLNRLRHRVDQSAGIT